MPTKKKRSPKPLDNTPELLTSEDVRHRLSDSFGAAVCIDTHQAQLVRIKHTIGHMKLLLLIDVDNGYESAALERRRCKVTVSRIDD